MSKSNGINIATPGSPIIYKRALAIFQRIFLTILSVLVSILVPDFGAVMAFLGSFSAFMLCVIGPISAKVMLAGRCGMFDAALLGLGVLMGVWGTVAAFLAA